MIATPSAATTGSNITRPTCEIAFEWKNGRRLANNRDVAYILPSDQTEVDRLQINHELWRYVCQSYAFIRCH